jgi:dolichol-phosphate mannosyltransferase
MSNPRRLRRAGRDGAGDFAYAKSKPKPPKPHRMLISTMTDSRPVPPAGAQRAGGPELSIVIPTLNEEGNIAMLVGKLDAALRGVEWEAIFVDDDSRDGTRAAVTVLARGDSRVRLIHRIGRRGLSSACIEGVQASTAPYVAVMDADLQHDETILPEMLQALKGGEVEVAIGSRYVAGGGIGGWDARRAGMSRFATRLGQLILRSPVSDPMSGFFMLRREAFEACVRRLSGVGFKILMDILASSERPLRVQELPYHFRQRIAGESKLDSMVAWEYVVLVADKTIGRYVPVRFILFALIGVLGLGVHLAVLGFALHVLGVPFPAAQATATGVAMIGNYTLNNALTYRDRRLRGWRFVRGLLSFVLICGVGAVANVGLASFLFGNGRSSWWVAGIAGAVMSSVWNYAVSAVFTWRAK